MKHDISAVRDSSEGSALFRRILVTLPAATVSVVLLHLLSRESHYFRYAFLSVHLKTIILCVGLCLATTVLFGQQVPRLEYVSSERTTSARVSKVPEYNQDEVADTTRGAFAQTTSANLTTYDGSGSAQSSHRSQITDLGISLKFDVSYQGTADEGSHRFTGRSALNATFQVTEPITAVLTGSIEFHGESGAGVQVVVFGAGVNRQFDDADLGGEPVPISENLDLEPGFNYFFSVSALVDESIFDGTSNGNVYLELVLDTGDEDFDGLPDKWEEDGIDGNGDGVADIDLPAYGADPRHKDLFIEVDLQTGSAYPLSALSRVVDAFADAPVPNPDGSEGIALHPIFDEISLPTIQYPADPREDVAAQKASYFGTVEQRNDPDWEQGIREVKLQSFRYCVIGGTQADGACGWGEIQGDDFIVTTDDKGYFSEGDYLATFMHELGHNLGLRHGGGDKMNFKPNHFSIMNYLFAFESIVGKYINWQLDYSRARLNLLKESALDEERGFGGPSPYYDDKQSVINVAPEGQSISLEPAPLRAGTSVDFDGDGSIDTDPVAADLNRITSRVGESPGQTMRGYNDWENVSLGFSGSDNFGKGTSAGLTTSSPEVSEPTPEDYESLTKAYSQLPEITSTGENRGQSHSSIRLYAPSPNPAHGPVRFTYSIPVRAEVHLTIYDLLGRRVATLVYTDQAAGRYVTTWDHRTTSGKVLASGKYFAVLQVQGSGITEQITQSFIILR